MLVCPAGTITELGTTALVELLDKETEVPPGPAGPDRFTVPVLVRPPAMELGLTLSPDTLAGVIVRDADTCEPTEMEAFV